MRRNSHAAPDDIERIYRERLPAFLRVAAAIAGDREAARDVVQDAFATALRRAASFRGDGPLEGWLWAIVVNTARNHTRRPTALPSTALPETAAVERDGGLAHVEEAVALLPERQRLTLFLRYYADLDYRAIAAALGVAEGTVAATLSAAHAALRKQLTQEVAS
jgi:RNA polymerase sigma-70 factor (ECF subfamily)